MTLFDEACARDNTGYLVSCDHRTGEIIIFSKHSDRMLFVETVQDPALRDAITCAIRQAEKIAYAEALREIKLKIDAHILT